jgi:hypothetical protein
MSGAARVVHIELASFIPMTSGSPYLLEVTGFPSFSWRGTCGQIAGACTTVDADLYPAGAASAAPTVKDFWFRTYVSDDADGDLIADPVDNCVSAANPGQENADANFIDNSPPYAEGVDDQTLANSDNQGDACDTDDDNDGVPDTTEASLPSLQAVCPQALATTDPLLLDTDGDRVTDAAECALGSDPNNAASKPANPPPAQDPDSDRLSTAFEGTIGTNPNLVDSDGDGMQDGWEYKGYGSNPLAIDTDADGTRDGCEAASLNGDTIVNPGDQAMLASEILRVPPPAKLGNFDLNKDGVINPGDQAFQASRIGPGKCP